MKVGVIGAGNVGLTVAAGLAGKGHEVVVADIDEEKVEEINAGRCPFHEEGVEEALKQNAQRVSATTDSKKAVKGVKVTFLAVDTPTKSEGIDLSNLKKAAEDAAKGLKGKVEDKNNDDLDKNNDAFHVFAIKSTVVPGTSEEVEEIIETVSGLETGEEFSVCSNPEFLRQGSALNDFLQPDRIVIGGEEEAADRLETLYNGFDAPVFSTDAKTAELVKYASNSFLATKISFINEIGNLCKELGIDVYDVADGMGLDDRICRDFLNSGDGFGGGCFPKDVRALTSFMEENDVRHELLEATLNVNSRQKKRLVELLEEKTDLEGEKIAVLGLSYKPGTDDISNSPAIDVIEGLKKRGAEVSAYDPEAVENMRQRFPSIGYVSSVEEALEGAAAALIVTKWDEFGDITLDELRLMETPLVLEGMKTDSDLPEDYREGVTWP